MIRDSCYNIKFKVGTRFLYYRIINNKNEVVKADELFVELLSQEVSCINILMMRYADRYCIGDLMRYKPNIRNNLNNVKNV